MFHNLLAVWAVFRYAYFFVHDFNTKRKQLMISHQGNRHCSMYGNWTQCPYSFQDSLSLFTGHMMNLNKMIDGVNRKFQVPIQLGEIMG